MRRVIAYVDGFNLFYGMKAKYGRAFHWLDPQALAATLIRPGERLEAVRYFTARVHGGGEDKVRQGTYLEALAAHCGSLTIHEGRFLESESTCPSCGAVWVTYVEKETDVNLATAIIEDAAHDRFDRVLLVSGDGDLCPAIRSARRIRPEARFVAVFPPKRHSYALKLAADGALSLGRDKLRRAQLPAKVVTPTGIELARPVYWN